MSAKVSVIIVSYNSEDFIEKCLVSLRVIAKQSLLGSEIIVLDNGSTDKTAEIIEKFPEIKLIKSNENLGFAKGNNKAVKEASGDYLFFLNPDTEIPKPASQGEQVRDDANFFYELISFYGKTSDVGIVAPRLVMENGQVQSSVRKLPTILGAFKEYILGMQNEYSQYVPDGSSPVEVEMVYGAAMLIKKDLFEKMGGFNEKYFLYYEDADLCKRVRESGKKIFYHPGVSVKHLVGATKSESDKSELNYGSSFRYHGLFGFLVLQLIFFLRRIVRSMKE